MICVQVLQDGTLRAINFDAQQTSESSCSGYTLVQAGDVQLSSQLPDPAMLAEFFSFGLAMVVGSYLGAFAVGSVLKVVRSR